MDIQDLFIGFVTEATPVGDLGRPSQLIYRVQKVAFYSLLSSKYDAIAESLASEPKGDDPVLVHPCAPLIKLLTQGSFYFSFGLDLTRSSQTRYLRATYQSDKEGVLPLESVPTPHKTSLDLGDDHFIWNLALLSDLVRIRQTDLDDLEKAQLDSSGMLLTLIQGYVGISHTTLRGTKCKMALLSRLSSKRAGTRFNARGMDDDGNVSNFAESEFLLLYKGAQFSFLQLRGSVPLFWEQVGIQVSHKITLTRGIESTLPATQKHFEELKSRYSHVHVVNLLGQKDVSGEFPLSESYRLAVARLKGMGEAVVFTPFDFHAIVKRDYDKIDELIALITDDMDIYASFFFDKETQMGTLQRGIFRTNCLDCLDRTNVVQTYVYFLTFFFPHFLRNSPPPFKKNSLIWLTLPIDGLPRRLCSAS